jgi:uncharacterized protein
MNLIQTLARELAVQQRQIEAAVTLMDDGATVPFIARYRKEATGGLDDTQLRLLEERLTYLRELDERRGVILASIREQGQLTTELEAALLAADTKTRLEDLYLPYKPKRRTKAQIAREAGLAPLAHGLLADPTQTPEQLAAAFIDAERGVADAKAALEGARQILMEEFAENAELLARLRELLWDKADAAFATGRGQGGGGGQIPRLFRLSGSRSSAFPRIAPWRCFAGVMKGCCSLNLEIGDPAASDPIPASVPWSRISNSRRGPAGRWLVAGNRALGLEGQTAAASGYRAETALARASRGGGDPGVRRQLARFAAGRPRRRAAHAWDWTPDCAPASKWRWWTSPASWSPPPRFIRTSRAISGMKACRLLAELCRRHRVELLSIGNGTASRETDRLASDLMKRHPESRLHKLVVSEAGASVYSASELAAREFPEVDVSLRGAVSIARRLQDPLAELVKIEPKAIGVGQYQHDVGQTRLARALDAVVEDCVNAVGVDVNTASAPLLARVAG